ncbi:CHAP domain-containing protein [Yinghuangia soli]|uniref:CHAP domain-containing protein n=1 Tax=Yinghuangia soli TaxID=2908204 RepID=A0AA41PTZ8_9ACTN|nr:CHAP domain-containing protein [Yinghuangia soli]MCF2525835.1 CHAP domain-containing protein [Yinghuangia soli]
MSTAADVIAIARAEVGYREGRDADGDPNNIVKYSPEVPGLGWAQGQPWCAVFVSWCAMKGDASTLFPRTASCGTGLQWFRDRGRASEYPAVGAQVFFGVGGTFGSGGHHTGLVYAYDANYIYTIEGNTNTSGSPEGDGVYLRKRSRRDPYVYRYGYPAYDNGIVSADPNWGGSKPSIPQQPSGAEVSLARVAAAARKDAPAAGTPKSYPEGVLLVERALVAEGLLRGEYADGSYGTKTLTAYAAWQRRLGYTGTDADGIPGKDSLKRLGAKHGFTVV